MADTDTEIEKPEETAEGQDKPKPSRITKRRFAVQIPGSPEKTVLAIDRLDAISVYKEQCGIIATIHEPTVKEAK